MKRKVAVVRLIGAVAALLIATWFVCAYSRFVGMRLQMGVDSADLTPACTMLRDYSPFAVLLPFLTAIAGVLMIAGGKEMGVSIVCQASWLLALALICFAIVAWEVPLIPILRLR